MAEIKRSLAVVIGINQYVNGIPELKTAVNDAIEIAHTLETKYQYQVLRLLDEDATGDHLKELFAAFDQQTLPLSDSDRAAVATLGASRTTTQLHPDSKAVATLGASDRLLFYFAGHGIALDALDNADGPVGFLVPQDARMDNDSSLLPMKRLHDALLALPCRHLLVILDCCFAGAFRWAGQREAVRSQKMYRERYERFISGCAQQVITSAADDEKAADSLYRFGQRSEDAEHSPFAQFLLKGLSGAADFTGDGVITATELYVYIHGELGKTSAKQTPGFCQLKRHDKGEYIFPIPSFEPNQLDKAPLLDENANPYKGLESFEENDSDKFFGRKALTEKLHEFVTLSPLTVVLGASGSGKSSLVKAGLIPLLKKNQDSWRILPPIRPGESPFNALNKALERENLPVFAIPNQVSNSSDNSQWYEQGLQNLSLNLTAWRNLHPNSKLLLVIDQSEEVVTLCRSDTEREMFLSGLARALKAFPDWLRIVLTLRSDFEPQFRDTALEPYWSGARFVVPAMTREELRQAIVEPASTKVMYFEPPTLVDQLIDEVVQMPGALPLLSFTLSELYLKYVKSVTQGKRNNRAITQEDYEELGGVARSLTQRADREYDELVKIDPAYEQTVRHVMLRMVAVGGGELARRRVFCTELEYPDPENARVKEVIERFVAARLLVKGRDLENHEYVEPAHDVLVRGWQKLLNWKQQEQENLILQRRLTPAALEWNSQQQAKFLWNADPRLDLLKQVLNSSHNWFNKLEAEFVRQSIRQKHKNIVGRWSLGIGAVVMLSSAAMIAIYNRTDALNNSLETYIASSEAYLSSGRELEALIEGVKAGKLLKKNQYSVREETRMQVLAHLGQLIHQVRERNRWKQGERSVNSVSFSPDGQVIASAGEDNTIKLWRRDGSPLQTLSGHENYVFSVSFCHDGQTLISASEDQTVKLWQRQYDNQFKFIKTILDREHIESVALSPDCQTISTSNVNSAVKLWTRDGKLLKTFTEKHRNQVRGLDFSPNGQLIASASLDGTIKLWRRKDGKLLKTIRDDGDRFYRVRFVDSKTLASASGNTTVKLWDLKGNKLKTVGKHGDEVLHLDVSRDGKTIASTSEDGTVMLWNVKPWSQEKAEKLLKFKVPSGIVKQVSFSPNSKMIALAGDDGTVRLLSRDGMDLSPKNLQGNSLSISPDSKMIVLGDKEGNVKLWRRRDKKLLWNRHAHKKDVQRVNFSPNGKIIASASLDGTVKLWNLNGELIQTLPGHKRGVEDMSFSPDGTTIASASKEIVKLWHWNGTSFSPFRTPIRAHNGAVTSVSFSPDGKTIASASRDNKIFKLWRLDGTPVHSFSGHRGGVFGVSFSPDGKIIASASSDSTVKIWHINRNSFQEELRGHNGSVYRVIFSSNGQVLASVGEDKTIKIWSRDGKLLKTLVGHDEPVWDVSFSLDGKAMASTDFGQKIVFWNLNLDDFMENYCNWIHNYLDALDANDSNNVCNNAYFK